jgi:RND superfamily putative drug exporter
MARLLYRLGLFSARRAWLVLTAWVIILAGVVTVGIAAGGTFTTSMSISGTPSQVVIDDLKQSFPAASKGSGQIVFTTTDGSAFTSDQQKVVSDALAAATQVSSVDSVVNPFTTQATIEAQRAQVADGAAKLAATKTDLDAKLAQVNSGLAQITAAASAMGIPASALPEPYATQLATLQSAKKQIEDGLTTVASKTAELEVAQKLLPATQNYRTVSSDNSTAVATVIFDTQLYDVESAEKQAVITAIQDHLGQGVTAEYSHDLLNDVSGILGVGEIVGVVIAGVVLFLMLGTFVAAGLPVLSALIGVGISAMITVGLSAVIEMGSTTPVLGVMLGLAVGIDYSLFILNRHRRQLKVGMDLRESIGLANGTSGNAVLFAGITVIIALVALQLTGIGFLALMGQMGAIAIAIAVLIALTFTPAMLSLVGTRVLSRKEKRQVAATEEAHTGFPPVSEKPVFAAKHPWATVIAVVAVLGVIAIPMSSLRLGLPDGSAEDVSSTQYRAYKLTSEKFGAGVNGQVVVIATIDKKLNDTDQLALQANVATRIMQLNNVESVIPALVSDSGTKLMFQVVPTEGPSSVQTEQLVYDLRALEPELSNSYGAEIGVTGITASNIDVSKKLGDALPIYLGTVILLSLVLMMLVFRSILVPLIASLGFLLTVVATLGAVVAVFQWGWLGAVFNIHDPGPVLSFLPTLLIGILFGLAMDYQLFLVSGMREAHSHGKDALHSINYGVHLSRAVVVAAAIIMVSVFGSFAFSHLTSVRPIGLGLAVGVLLDAFLVRLLLVPATMAILGKSAWWLPKWLDKILPNVDVEGAALERGHAGHAAQTERADS